MLVDDALIPISELMYCVPDADMTADETAPELLTELVLNTPFAALHDEAHCKSFLQGKHVQDDCFTLDSQASAAKGEAAFHQ